VGAAWRPAGMQDTPTSSPTSSMAERGILSPLQLRWPWSLGVAVPIAGWLARSGGLVAVVWDGRRGRRRCGT